MASHKDLSFEDCSMICCPIIRQDEEVGSLSSYPSEISPAALAQVNHLIDSNHDYVVSQFQVEMKQLIRNQVNEIQIERRKMSNNQQSHRQSTDLRRYENTNYLTRTISAMTRLTLDIDNDAQQHVSLPQDTFSLMMVSKPLSRSWWAGFGIYSLQITLLILLCREMFVEKNIMTEFTETPSAAVSIAQFFVLLAIFALQSDLVESVRSLFILEALHIRYLAVGDDDPRKENQFSMLTWFVLPNLIKLIMAIVTIVVTLVVTLQSETILDLLKDFTALMIINEIDNLSFAILVQNGYCSLKAKKKADEITARSVKVDAFAGGKCRRDVWIISLIYSLAVTSWIVILGLQINAGLKSD